MSSRRTIPPGWCQSISVAGTAGSLREVAPTHDLVGNVLGLTSPDVNLSWIYRYDDWHRMTQATGGTGTETFTWSDSGDLAGRSGVGAFVYGENGMASTLLSKAGTDAFTYDANGSVITGPWGTNHFDAEGNFYLACWRSRRRPPSSGNVTQNVESRDHRSLPGYGCPFWRFDLTTSGLACKNVNGTPTPETPLLCG